MNSYSLGNLARLTYRKWLHHQLSVVNTQERNMIYELATTKNYITKEVLEEAAQGARFRRFYYNELHTSDLYYKPLSNYEVNLILKNEGFDISYESDSFVVRWLHEPKKSVISDYEEELK